MFLAAPLGAMACYLTVPLLIPVLTPRPGPAGQAGPPAAVARDVGAEAVLEPGRPDGVATPGAHIWYRSDVIEVVEQYLYRPVRRPFLRLVRLAKRLQSGRLDAYLAYLQIALIAVVTAVR